MHIEANKSSMHHRELLPYGRDPILGYIHVKSQTLTLILQLLFGALKSSFGEFSYF